MKKQAVMAKALIIGLLLPGLITCAPLNLRKNGRIPEASKVDKLRDMRTKFADVEIAVDKNLIRPSDMKVLPHLVKAAMVMDRLFWKQVSNDGVAIRNKLAKEKGKYARLVVDMMDINFGVYDRLDHFKPFYGDKARFDGATFYPADMTAKEFETWLAGHPGDTDAFQSWLTIIQRDGVDLKAVPYSEFYREDLREAAAHLREAAAATDDGTLKKYLLGRADSFETNDYLQSDMDWMDLGDGLNGTASGIEVVIGPYEVYEDSLLGLKAAFEAFVTVVDEAESKKLSMVAGMLDELESNLPLPDHFKNFSRGKMSPIKVVNVVYTAGDTKAGVQTAAFNLPNDERVRNLKGSKKVMLRNVTRAKFDKALIPISKAIIARELLPQIDFDAYFNFILMHEVSHGLGPGIISLADGSKTTVNLALKDLYSAIEECKADTLSVYNTLYMAKKGIFNDDFVAKTEASYLAGLFRSVRFGIGEAHGKSNILQFNYLKEKGAITYDEKTGRFGLDRSRFADAIRDLSAATLVIEADGNYSAAAELISKYVYIPQEVAAALARLTDVPVDIKPVFTLGNELSGM